MNDYERLAKFVERVFAERGQTKDSWLDAKTDFLTLSDDDFIAFCETHSLTKLALFHVTQIQRIAELAQHQAILERLAQKLVKTWVFIPEYAMTPLTVAARRNLAQKKT